MRQIRILSILGLILGCAIDFSIAQAPPSGMPTPESVKPFSPPAYLALRNLDPKTLMSRAQAGDPAAELELANRYFYEGVEFSGSGFNRDENQSWIWLQKAAVQRFPPAETQAGLHFRMGDVDNECEALKWFTQASGDGDADGMWDLADLVDTMNQGGAITGGCQKPDSSLAATWRLNAVRNGSIVAQLYFAQNLVKDPAQRVSWYRHIAQYHVALAEFLLGKAYQEGLGVAQDLNQARDWYLQAIETNNNKKTYDYHEVGIVDFGSIPNGDAKIEIARIEESQRASKIDLAHLPDINTILRTASSRKVSPTAENNHGKECNKLGASDDFGSVQACYSVASFGHDGPDLEAAALRLCSFGAKGETDMNGCALLGRELELEGKPELALSIYLNAPNCHAAQMNVYADMACTQAAALLFHAIGNFRAEAATVKALCNAFGEPSIRAPLPNSIALKYPTTIQFPFCTRWNELGGSADLAVARQKFTDRQKDDEASAREVNAGLQAAYEARRNQPSTLESLASTLQGIAATNNIQNTAAQQQANIRAVGDANAARQQQQAQAAAQQQAAQQRAAQQAAAQQAAQQQAAQQAAQARNSSGSTSNPSTGGDPGLYVAPLSFTCIGEFYDPQNYNWLSFQNNCGQPIHLAWIARNPNDTYGIASADIATGQAVKTGWSSSEVAKKNNFAVYPCPAGYVPVDAATHQPVNSANETYTCKKW